MYNNQYNKNPQYEKHIENEEMYRDFIRNLKKGEHWKMDDLMARCDVDFNVEQFTPYDYAYVVNALHSDFDISERPEQYMKMAKEYLHNDSFPEKGGERAYHDAQRRLRRYMSRYDGYMPKNEYNQNYNYQNNNYDYRNAYNSRY